MAKEPGPGGFDLRPVSLDLSFAETFGIRYPDAYERLLMEVLRGNPALFMRRDEVEAAWDWIDGIIDGWEETETKGRVLCRRIVGTDGLIVIARSRWSCMAFGYLIVTEHYFESRQEASAAAARRIVELLSRRLDNNDEASLVVSGGTSPGQCFAALAATELDWQRVQVALSDERWVPPGARGQQRETGARAAAD